MVIAIMNSIITHFKQANDAITKLVIKSDNASNFKNESVISFLRALKIPGKEPGNELTVAVYMFNEEG